MSFVDSGQAPSESGAVLSAEEAEEQERKRQEEAKASSPLNQLVPEHDDKLYQAMEHFLLLEPERQVNQLGGIDALAEDGAKNKERGNYTMARIAYENAAKIAIYQQNKEAARKYLLLADEVTEKDEDKEIHRRMLDDMDNVLRISREYHERKKGEPTEEQKYASGVYAEEATDKAAGGVLHPP
jgi:hypothetical protein